MKTFLADIIPSIQRYSKKLDDLSWLNNHHWVSLGDIHDEKKVFIFRSNKQLLISINGIVEKGTWDYIGNQSILIEIKNDSFLLRHGFLDEYIFALKLDGTQSYAFLINETKFNTELNTIQDVLSYLKMRYSTQSNQNIKHFTKPNKFPNYIEEEPVKTEMFFGVEFYTIKVHFEDYFDALYRFYPKKNKYSYFHTLRGELFFEDKKHMLVDLFNDRIDSR